MFSAQVMDDTLDALFEDLSKCKNAQEIRNDLFWFLGLINLYLETENQLFVQKNEISIVCKWLQQIEINKKAHLDALNEILDARNNNIGLTRMYSGDSNPVIEYE